MKQCKCGSYAFNLYKEDIDQGDLCDVHYWKEKALAQPEQEPVAIVHRNEYNEYRLEPHDNFDIKSIPFNIDVPLFKSPQRTWVGLTDEQIESLFPEKQSDDGLAAYWLSFAKSIEAKLKEKNGA